MRFLFSDSATPLLTSPACLPPISSPLRERSSRPKRLHKWNDLATLLGALPSPGHARKHFLFRTPPWKLPGVDRLPTTSTNQGNRAVMIIRSSVIQVIFRDNSVGRCQSHQICRGLSVITVKISRDPDIKSYHDRNLLDCNGYHAHVGHSQTVNPEDFEIFVDHSFACIFAELGRTHHVPSTS